MQTLFALCKKATPRFTIACTARLVCHACGLSPPSQGFVIKDGAPIMKVSTIVARNIPLHNNSNTEYDHDTVSFFSRQKLTSIWYPNHCVSQSVPIWSFSVVQEAWNRGGLSALRVILYTYWDVDTYIQFLLYRHNNTYDKKYSDYLAGIIWRDCSRKKEESYYYDDTRVLGVGYDCLCASTHEFRGASDSRRVYIET